MNNGWGTFGQAHIAAKENAVTQLANKLHNDRTRLFDAWQEKKKAFELAQAEEREARAAMMEAWSDRMNDPMADGAESIDTGFGTLTITHKIDYKVTGAEDAVETALDKIEASQEGGNVIAERLVKFKPELSVREYKLLTEAQRKIVDAVLTIKPASKSVAFKPVAGA